MKAPARPPRTPPAPTTARSSPPRSATAPRPSPGPTPPQPPAPPAAHGNSIVEGPWPLLTVAGDVNGPVKASLDGRLQNTATSELGRKPMNFSAIGALTVAAADGTVQGYNSLNNADLDDVRIYDRVLTDAEVAS